MSMKTLLITFILIFTVGCAREPVEYETVRERPVSEGSFKQGAKSKRYLGAYKIMCEQEPEAEACPDD